MYFNRLHVNPMCTWAREGNCGHRDNQEGRKRAIATKWNIPNITKGTPARRAQRVKGRPEVEIADLDSSNNQTEEEQVELLTGIRAGYRKRYASVC